MIRIKRRKLIICNAFLYGGLLLMVIGAILYPWLRDNHLYLILIGSVIALIGSYLSDKLYRCPKCGAKLLVVGSPLDILFGKIPRHCPNCGVKIEIQIF